MKWVLALAVLFGSLMSVFAQPQSIPGLIAKRETEALSYEDKLAAYDAEQAVLAQGGIVLGYNWKGPKGAYGTIIMGGIIPQPGRFAICRRFTHIVHHKNDGGRNPTFLGTVCRNSEGRWEAEPSPRQGAIELNPVLIGAGGEILPDIDRLLVVETEERVLDARFPGGDGYNWYGPSGAKGNVRTIYVNGEPDECRTLRHRIEHASGEVAVAEAQLCRELGGKWVPKR